MRYVSLFSGIEAASVAWEPLGWEPAAFAEIEPFPCKVLEKRFPGVPNLGDVSKVDWSPYAGAVDVVVGGSPCQAFSVAGKRKGLMDERGRLMLEYVRAVRDLGPRWLVWENVPGVLSQDGGRAFGILLGALDDIGYSLAWRVLDAQFFGVAQRRRRVFLVGHLGAGGGAPAAVLFEPDSVSGNIKSGRQKREELAGFPQGGAGIGREPVSFKYHQGGKAAGMHAPLLCVADDNSNAAVDDDVSGTLKCGGGVAVDSIASNGADVCGTLCARDYKGVGGQDIGEGKVIVQWDTSSEG